MNDMDTNINNYSHNELLQLLNIEDEVDVDGIVNNTFKILNKIEESNVEKKGNLLEFFKRCFMKIMNTNNYRIDKSIFDSLQLYKITNHEYSMDRVTTLPTPIPTSSAIHTIQSEYAYGTINPIKRDTINHVLLLHSKYEQLEKINVYNKKSDCNCKIKVADFTTTLSEPYKNVISIKINSIYMNNTYYPFSNYLDTVSFTIRTFDYNPSMSNPTKENVTNTEIVISEGIYNISSLLSAVNNEIQDVSSNIVNSVKLLYDNVMGKYIFFLDSSFSNYGFDIDFKTVSNPKRPSYLNIGWLMGFQKEYYDYFEEYNPIGFIAECPAKLIGSSFFLIEVEDYNKNNPILINYNINSPYSFNLKNLLGIIPNKVDSTNRYKNATNHELLPINLGGIYLIANDCANENELNDGSREINISSTDVFKPRRYFGPVRLQKLRIRLLDENGRVLYLNNSNFTLSLEIETLFSNV